MSRPNSAGRPSSAAATMSSNRSGSTSITSPLSATSRPRGAGSGGPPVGPDRERREYDEDPGQPGDALPQAGLELVWVPEGQRAHRVDDLGDGLVVGEGL